MSFKDKLKEQASEKWESATVSMDGSIIDVVKKSIRGIAGFFRFLREAFAMRRAKKDLEYEERKARAEVMDE